MHSVHIYFYHYFLGKVRMAVGPTISQMLSVAVLAIWNKDWFNALKFCLECEIHNEIRLSFNFLKTF